MTQPYIHTYETDPNCLGLQNRENTGLKDRIEKTELLLSRWRNDRNTYTLDITPKKPKPTRTTSFSSTQGHAETQLSQSRLRTFALESPPETASRCSHRASKPARSMQITLTRKNIKARPWQTPLFHSPRPTNPGATPSQTRCRSSKPPPVSTSHKTRSWQSAQCKPPTPKLRQRY